MKFSFVISFLFFVSAVFAQNMKKGEATSFQYSDFEYKHYPIDTGLTNFEEYNFEQQNGWEYYNLGLIGSAEQTLDFQWNFQKGFQDGNIFFNNYKYCIPKIKYYNVSKLPYSALYYSLGSRFEQIVKLVHSQNIKNRFQYTLEAKGLSGSGIYSDGQKTRNIGISFYGIYTSKNERYRLEADAVYSSIKTNEIGGVKEDVLTDFKENKLFYSTYLDDGVTEQSDLNLLLSNSYSFGIHKIDSASDSIQIKRFYPNFTLKHSIGTNIVKQSFVDIGTDSTFWGAFDQNPLSISNELNYYNLPHSVSFHYLGLKNGDSVRYNNFQAEIKLQHNNIEIWHNSRELSTNNLRLEAKIESNSRSKSELDYQLSSYFIFTGYNQNDFGIDGEFQYDFNKFGRIHFSSVFQSLSPSWIENNYESDSKNWNNQFKKKQIFESKFTYSLDKHQLRIQSKYNLLSDYIYFDNSSTPTQFSEDVSYWNISIQKNTNWKIWHWNNFIGFQTTSHPSVIQLPMVFLKSSLYAEFKTFKSNLLLSTGIDLRFNTSFNSRAWNPLIAQFYTQEEERMNYTPVVDVFLNAKIKSVRIYAKLNYANEGLFVNNNYKALNYPTNGRTFSFGGTWRFFE